MHSGTQERRRKFYGWGYEGDEVPPQEIAEFEKACVMLPLIRVCFTLGATESLREV